MNVKKRRQWGLALMVLGVMLMVALVVGCGAQPPWWEDEDIVALGVTHFSGLDVTGTETDLLVVDQTSTGDIIELRDNGTVVWRVADGGAVTQAGNTSLGDAITDNVYVYGQMRTYDGTDNWSDISDVSALDRGNGWHDAYKILGWGTGTQFQALFANTQVSATMAATNTIHGAELKATASNGNNHLGTAIGAYGKLTIKDTGSQLAAGYPFYSIIDVNNSGVITTSASYYAELSGETTLGTVSVLQAKSGDTWDYGLNFAGATLTNEIVGQNSETISNSPNGEWDFGSANLDTSGDIDGDDVNAGSTMDIGTWLNLSAQTTLAIGADETITPTGTYQPITSTTSITCDTTTCVADGNETGDVLILRNGNVTDTITIDGTGANVECKSNVVLGAGDTLTLIWNGSDWNCLSGYDNS